MNNLLELKAILDEDQKVRVYIENMHFNAYEGTAKGLYAFIQKYGNLGNFSADLTVADMFVSAEDESLLIISCRTKEYYTMYDVYENGQFLKRFNSEEEAYAYIEHIEVDEIPTIWEVKEISKEKLSKIDELKKRLRDISNGKN